MSILEPDHKIQSALESSGSQKIGMSLVAATLATEIYSSGSKAAGTAVGAAATTLFAYGYRQESRKEV